jgi:hypothetical protein
MLFYSFLVLAWFVLGFCFAFALIHHAKAIAGRETYIYLKELGQEVTFNSRKYAMTKGDVKVSMWLSFLGPICVIMFLIKCLSDAIVTVINLVSRDKTIIG